MPKAIAALRAACLGLALCGTAARAETLAPADRAALQAAMAQHIDRQLVDGGYLHLDAAQGTVRALAPAKTHSRIIQMGRYYVLCTDFRDQQGGAVNVDFYLASAADRSFVVFHTEIANRAPLQNLLRAGRVKAVE